MSLSVDVWSVLRDDNIKTRLDSKVFPVWDCQVQTLHSVHSRMHSHVAVHDLLHRGLLYEATSRKSKILKFHSLLS